MLQMNQNYKPELKKRLFVFISKREDPSKVLTAHLQMVQLKN